MTLQIVPRATIGVPDPGNREHLAVRLAWLLGHYTGVAGYNDSTKDLQYAQSVARFGRQAGKPFEYSYLIGLGGTVFEQAGDRMASHCLNFNRQSYGVLLMLGVGVQPTAAMIDSFRQLRAHLIDTGQLHPQHQASPHYRFRATGCPGSTVATAQSGSWKSPTGEGRLGDLLQPFLLPWVAPKPPPIENVPPAHEENDMAKLVKTDDGDNAIFAVSGLEAVWCESRTQIAAGQALGAIAGTGGGGEVTTPRSTFAALTLVGPAPSYAGMANPPAKQTVATDFRRQIG